MLEINNDLKDQKKNYFNSKSFIKLFGSSSKIFKQGNEIFSSIIGNFDKESDEFRKLVIINPTHNDQILCIQIYYISILRGFLTSLLKTIKKPNYEPLKKDKYDLEVKSNESYLNLQIYQNINYEINLVNPLLELNTKLLTDWNLLCFKKLNQFINNKLFLKEILTIDLFQALYANLFPGPLRKILGEVYTPIWLAKYIADQSSWGTILSGRILDPSCGSGTFIKAFITKIRKKHESTIEKKDLFYYIIENIQGFDINPIAVFTSKLNYFLHIYDMIPEKESVSIPIFMKDVFSTETPIKNKFDHIIGNPPWINWENLTDKKKKTLTNIWNEINSLNYIGINSMLGHTKQDISGLFFIQVVEKFLNIEGKISFILNKSLINGKANEFFRKYLLEEVNKNSSIKNVSILKIEDLSSFQPFKNVRTATIILHGQRDKEKQDKFPYTVWKSVPKKNNSSLENLSINDFQLDLIEANWEKMDPESNIIIPNSNFKSKLTNKTKNKSKKYIAKEGSNTEGLNAGFWIKGLERANGNLIKFTNYNHRQSNKIVLKNEIPIETDLVFPLIRSGNISKWLYTLDTFIIFTAKYYLKEFRNEQSFKKNYPNTLKYFSNIENDLKSRKSYNAKSKNLPFYIMYGHSDMISDYKVCWKRMGKRIESSVIGKVDNQLIGRKSPIPQETVVYINVGANFDEAHYLCSIINSDLFNRLVSNIKIPGSKSFGTPDILNYINIPEFDKNNKNHNVLANNSKLAHEFTLSGKYPTHIDEKNNSLVNKIFN